MWFLHQPRNPFASGRETEIDRHSRGKTRTGFRGNHDRAVFWRAEPPRDASFPEWRAA